MWADIETEQDFLNYSEVAEITTDLLCTDHLLPLSIGIFGGWGAGKSSLLRLVERGLKEKGNGFLVIKFDAWLYQGYDDARAALMDVIAAQLLEEAKSDTKLYEKVVSLAKRVNYFRAAGLALDGAALAMGLPTFGLISRGTAAIGRMMAADPLESDPAAIKSAASDITERGKGLIKGPEERTPPKEIEKFRKELDAVLTGIGKTLVVFIDNLDRCLPRNAIHTLEAIRLFLFLPRTAFVVAADDEMIRHSVSEHYGQLGTRHITDYLDKLIQIPIRVPRLGVREVRAYMMLLFASTGGLAPEEFEVLRKLVENNLRDSWKEDPIKPEALTKSIVGPNKSILQEKFELADRLAPLLANSTRVGGNPRIVKRILNVVGMRITTAKRRGMSLDEAVIAKLTLFERCMDSDATAEFYKIINESGEGKPKLLSTLESSLDDPEKLQSVCPKSWHTHLIFLTEWLTLQPKLSGVNLRPAVYLSRETTPLRFVGSNLSAPAEQALRILLKLPSSISKAGGAAIAQIPKDEHTLVMQSICSELRKTTDWKAKPMGFDGALRLADESPQAGSVLAQHIRSLKLKPMPHWLNAAIKDADWFKSEGGL